MQRLAYLHLACAFLRLPDAAPVNFKLDKVKAGDELLEDLHMLLYKSKGKVSKSLSRSTFCCTTRATS